MRPVSWLATFISTAFPERNGRNSSGIVAEHDRSQWRVRAGITPDFPYTP